MKTISDAKNEYTMQLINVLTPNIIQGIKSIFKEALDLCIQNDEKNKYLMTFQNFLTRVPKWNQSIIDNESDRIIKESNCNYLEDLITCVHITQLKILTSIRVSNNQKKINIEIPKINNFIHKVYINYARKLYSNIFLFDITIPSLEIQKNNRELEIICNESILNTIRNSIPIEKILNAYIDETTEDEEIITKKDETAADIDTNENKSNIKDEEDKNTLDKNGNDNEPATSTSTDKKQEIIINKTNNENKTTTNIVNKEKLFTTNSYKVEKKPDLDNNYPLIQNNINKLKTNDYEKSNNSGLLFNNNDTLIEFDTNAKTDVTISKTQINAPKKIDILEKISEENNRKRKLEEEEEFCDDDKIKIDMSSKPLNNIELDIETL